MLLNMSLYLSDSNKDKTIVAPIYHTLAEAYFIGSEHGRCIDAGKECFKLQPVKSEVFFFLVSLQFLNNRSSRQPVLHRALLGI